MLKDFAKASPITFFALPVIVIGMIVLSYFLYSTLITNQIESRQQYLEKQLELSSSKVEQQILEFKKEFPYLADLDDFSSVFNVENQESEKLRYRLKRAVGRYRLFVDSVFIFNQEQLYYISTERQGAVSEGFKPLNSTLLPLQFTNKPKIVHLKGSKILLMSPLSLNDSESVYLGAVLDVIEIIAKEALSQYTGEFSCKVIFTENMGFQTIEKGSEFNAEYQLPAKYKQQIIADLLENKKGNVLHNLPHNSMVFMSAYQPFKVFKERFGLLFVLSEDDFVAPVKSKLQIIFIAFFIMIGIVLVVFINTLKDVSQNNEELYQSQKNLSETLLQQRLILDHSNTFYFTLNKNCEAEYTTGNIEKLTGIERSEFFKMLPELINGEDQNEKIKAAIEQLKTNPSAEDVHFKVPINDTKSPITIEFRMYGYFDDKKFIAILGTGKVGKPRENTI